MKHRVESIRLKHWDYSSSGYYFVTICAKNRECYFGDIVDGKTKLSLIGNIIQKYWLEIPSHFSSVELDEYIVMPNHIHGIIIVNNIINNAGNRHACSLQKDKPQYRKLPIIIGSFKSSVTRHINKIQDKIFFQRQKSYYDHIIRNEKSLNKIREYIKNNPYGWHFDKDNPENLT